MFLVVVLLSDSLYFLYLEPHSHLQLAPYYLPIVTGTCPFIPNRVKNAKFETTPIYPTGTPD
jgi:hypothetical protein